MGMGVLIAYILSNFLVLTPRGKSTESVDIKYLETLVLCRNPMLGLLHEQLRLPPVLLLRPRRV